MLSLSAPQTGLTPGRGLMGRQSAAVLSGHPVFDGRFHASFTIKTIRMWSTSTEQLTICHEPEKEQK